MTFAQLFFKLGIIIVTKERNEFEAEQSCTLNVGTFIIFCTFNMYLNCSRFPTFVSAVELFGFALLKCHLFVLTLQFGVIHDELNCAEHYGFTLPLAVI